MNKVLKFTQKNQPNKADDMIEELKRERDELERCENIILFSFVALWAVLMGVLTFVPKGILY